jgi:hypothetical protein
MYKTSPNEILQRIITSRAPVCTYQFDWTLRLHQRKILSLATSEARSVNSAPAIGRISNAFCYAAQSTRLYYLRRRHDLVSIATARTEFGRTLFLLSQVQWHQPINTTNGPPQARPADRI